MSILYGIEMEFCAPLGVSIFLENFPPGWVLKNEHQHNAYESYWDYEINSPIFNEFPMKDIAEICYRMRKLKGGKIHRKCGVHIHFSGKIINESLLTQKLLQYKFPWKKREYFCSINSCDPKYRPIRRHYTCENHYECRLFNGSLNPRAIHNYWKILDKLIKECAVPEFDSDPMEH